MRGNALPDDLVEVAPVEEELDAEAAYEKFVWDNLPRNFAGHFMHGMLGMTGFRLFNAPTFLPAYLHQISGGSALAVGLGQFLQQIGGFISPIIGAAQIEHRKRVLPVSMLMGTMMRLGILGISLAGWFLTGNPQALLVTTLIFLFLMGFFQGAQGVAFQLLLAKVIPIQRRGTLQALRNVIGGIVAAGLSWWAGRFLIQKNVFGNGYATTFFLAVILTSAGLTALALLMREPEPPTVRPKAGVWERLKESPALIAEDRNFMFFMIAQLLSTAGRVAAPFYILSAGRAITLDGKTLGAMSLAFLGADTATNFGWGFTGDKLGFRATFIGSLLLWIAATALLIAAPHLPTEHLGPITIGGIAWVFLAFFGLGAAQSGQMMSSSTMVLEFGTREDMAMRLALTQTAQGLTFAVGPLLGSLLVTLMGYDPLFMVSIGFLTSGLLILTFMVKEPRHLNRARD